MTTEKPATLVDDVSIVLCGEAGQGIQTIEQALTRLLKLGGYNVFATKEYMSRIRGGSNSTQLRAAAKRVCAPVDRIDILIALNKGALRRFEEKTSPETIVLEDRESVGDDLASGRYRGIDVPLSKIATEIGNKVYANIVAVGVIAGLLRIEQEALGNFLKEFFSRKDAKIIGENVEAAKRGYAIGSELLGSGTVRIDVAKNPRVKDELLLSGGEAVSLGALAGGCNFISSYPMSPSTPVLTFLSQHAREFDMIAEQAEDEISAINMALGASYAGARAMVTTSGGGFALMTEGVSLAGMLETPVVIHIAQRPGPATGLPTRTEQADLELALYAGHGEFPRIIFAPGTLEQAFFLAEKAFNLADKFQVPVFILTDQYFIDSYYNIPALDAANQHVERHIVKTDKDYKRYRLTEDGISPRGVPGFGEGLVVLDSDEHDEEGHITEDLDLRTKMVEKRRRRLEAMRTEAVAPELIGGENYKVLVVGWGSTYHMLREARERLARDDVSVLHFSQVYPLPPVAADYLRRAEKNIIVENNATAQLGKLIKLQTGIAIEQKVLKYNGLPFSVEEVLAQLEEV
jgi:2-oxoglutarate ferredoxin oxidoreductase subunit alpha